MNWIFYFVALQADPSRKCCSAGRYRTPDNVCKDCPKKTWSKDAANICCPDGQYEGLDALCENCPPGTYLKWRTERSSEKNKCRTCGKGKVSQAGSVVCTVCTAGTYADHKANICVPCPANTYAKAQSDVCTPCPLDMYSSLGDAKCSKCLKGYKLNAERTGCQLVNCNGDPTTSPPTRKPTSPRPTHPPTIQPSGPTRPLGDGIVTTVAGNGTFGYSGDGGPATSASLNEPVYTAVDVSGNIYIADNRYRIRMVTKSTGIITTVAGDGTSKYSGDGGPAIYAGLKYLGGIAVDASGNICIGDAGNRVRMVTKSTGIITTVAGNGTRGYSGDGGPATSAILDFPKGVAFDVLENIYVLVQSRIRMVTKSTGIITTVAGDGTYGYSGDGGPATSASLNEPGGIAVDASGNIYIADSLNDRIRMVTKSTGIITTVAGNGIRGYAGDGGPATSAGLYYPNSVAVDASGNIYFADGSTNIVRKVTKSSGIITTEAGNGIQGFSGDGGPATLASFDAPYGLAVDASGTIYIADIKNNRVRIVSY